MARMSRFVRGAVVLAGGMWVISAAASAAHAQDADQLYEKSCKNCHGPSGKGDGAAAKMLKPPPADLGTVLKGKSDAEVAKIIKEGGKALGKSALMPAFGTKLSDDQINSLVQLVKGFSAK
jgi:cytochrome c oxidase cbb3-type subunit 3